LLARRVGGPHRIVLDLNGGVPQVDSERVFASGFAERTDPAALIIGPTGVGLSRQDGVLYIADTLGNDVTAVPAALELPGPLFGTGFTLSRGGALNGPLGLVVAPNNDVITVNSSDGNAVETSPFGTQVATLALDTIPSAPAQPGAGALFGVALTPQGNRLYFVDDDGNTLNVVS